MAPHHSAVFKGFDTEKTVDLRRYIQAVEYFLLGGQSLEHQSLQNLGDTPEIRFDRLQTIRAALARRMTDQNFASALQLFLGAWDLEDEALLAAARTLAACTAQDGQDPASTSASICDPNDLEAIEAQTSDSCITLPSGCTESPSHIQKKRTATRVSSFTSSYIPTNLSTNPPANSLSSTPAKSRGLHAPNLQRGYHCWNDGTLDRNHVKVGQPDPTKFRIALSTRKLDLKALGGYKPGNGAVYSYPNEKGFVEGDTVRQFDWNNAHHVKKLHQWREQVFRRRIGGVRPTRKNWLESEKHHALALIQEQLKTHRRPKFKKLANVFNRRFNGTTQRRGEKQVFNGNAKNGGLLEEDRPAPWRTASALAGQTFKWNEYDDLIKKRDQERGTAVIQNDVVSSDDEDEIPDPVPPQIEFKPRRYKSSGGLQAWRSTTKKSGTTVKAEFSASNKVLSSPSPTKTQIPQSTSFEGKQTRAEDEAEQTNEEANDDSEELSEIDSDNLITSINA